MSRSRHWLNAGKFFVHVILSDFIHQTMLGRRHGVSLEIKHPRAGGKPTLQWRDSGARCCRWWEPPSHVRLGLLAIRCM